jgi:hypothetical protein
MLGSTLAQQLRMIRYRRRFWFLLHRSKGLLLAPIGVVGQMVRLLRRLRRPGPSPDPYAGVRVPKPPLLPQRSTSIALDEFYCAG